MSYPYPYNNDRSTPQPDLTPKPTTGPVAEPMPDLEPPLQDLRSDDATKTLETEMVTQELPLVVMPSPDPTPSESSIVHIFDDA